MVRKRQAADDERAVDNSADCGQLGPQEAAAFAADVELLEAELFDPDPFEPEFFEPEFFDPAPLDVEPSDPPLFEPPPFESDFEPESDSALAGRVLADLSPLPLRLSVR